MTISTLEALLADLGKLPLPSDEDTVANHCIIDVFSVGVRTVQISVKELVYAEPLRWMAYSPDWDVVSESAETSQCYVVGWFAVSEI